jgi:hypothetical protein
MRATHLPLLVALFLAGLGSDAGRADDAPMTASEVDAIRQQVISPWFFDSNNPCKRKVQIRITLAPDGTVQRSEGLDDFAGLRRLPGRAQDAALRAVSVSSPLHLPAGKYWPTVVLIFDPSLVQ